MVIIMEKNKKEKLSKETLYLDDKLSKENDRIKFLNETEECTSRLNKSIGRCLNLLSEMHDSSASYYKKIIQSIETELTQSKNEITLLRKKQDELSKQLVEEASKEE